MTETQLQQIVSRDFPDAMALLAVVVDHPDLDHHPRLQGALSAIDGRFRAIWEALEQAIDQG